MDLIVILERTGVTPLELRYLLRAQVPVARRTYFADPNAVSAYKGASVADNDALKSGEYVEVVREHLFTGLNQAQIRSTLIEEQAAFQAKVTADSGWNPYKYYGTRWDGATWTAAGVN